jgi:hypothetical protein
MYNYFIWNDSKFCRALANVTSGSGFCNVCLLVTTSSAYDPAPCDE